MGSLSIWHWLIVILVVVLLFGRNKISDLMGDVARGVKSFKKGLSDEDEAKALEEKPTVTVDVEATREKSKAS
jgi:sec-independent protein translocase protein TatA